MDPTALNAASPSHAVKEYGICPVRRCAGNAGRPSHLMKANSTNARRKQGHGPMASTATPPPGSGRTPTAHVDGNVMPTPSSCPGRAFAFTHRLIRLGVSATLSAIVVLAAGIDLPVAAGAAQGECPIDAVTLPDPNGGPPSCAKCPAGYAARIRTGPVRGLTCEAPARGSNPNPAVQAAL